MKDEDFESDRLAMPWLIAALVIFGLIILKIFL